MEIVASFRCGVTCTWLICGSPLRDAHLWEGWETGTNSQWREVARMGLPSELGFQVRRTEGKERQEGLGWLEEDAAEPKQFRRGLAPEADRRDGVGLAGGSLDSTPKKSEKAGRSAEARTSTQRTKSATRQRGAGLGKGSTLQERRSKENPAEQARQARRVHKVQVNLLPKRSIRRRLPLNEFCINGKRS